MKKNKFLIIGCNSFSGSNFVKELLLSDYEVLGVSRSENIEKVFLPYLWEDNIKKFPSSLINFNFEQIDLNSNLSKLISIIEGDRAAHYKGATKPEEYDEKQKSSKGAMDMLKTPKSVEADGMKAAKDTADNIKKSAPGKKLRKGDQNKGDLTIKPSATPVKDPAAKMQTAESYGILGKAMPNSLLDAINKVVKEK